MRVLTILRVLAYCCVAVPAGAQVTFANIRTDLMPTVYVTDHAGQETKGQLVSLGDSSLVIRTATETRSFAPGDVSHVDRKGNSVRKGKLIGLALGLLESAAEAHRCGRQLCGGTLPATMLINTVILTATGAAIGALIPGRTRIWSGKPVKVGRAESP